MSGENPTPNEMAATPIERGYWKEEDFLRPDFDNEWMLATQRGELAIPVLRSLSEIVSELRAGHPSPREWCYQTS